MWCVPALDEEYIERMEDVLEVYERPLDAQQPVVCVDEKPVALHADVRPPTPALPGREARQDSEYQRCGTANVFCAVEPKAGRHFTFATPNRSGEEFAQVLFHLAMAYPQAETIHLVMDNLSTHRQPSLTNFYGEQIGGEIWDRFTIHYTPVHGSWLNQAEIEIGILSRQCLGRRRIPDLTKLGNETKAWNKAINRKGTTIDWGFTREKARRKFKYECPLFKQSEN
jgi:transposase